MLRILWIWTDLLVALGIVVAVGTYMSIDTHYRGFSVVLIFAPVSLAYVVISVIAAAARIVRDRWTRAIASAAKAVIFIALWQPCLRTGDYVHLALFYPVYRQQIDARQVGSTAPIRFDWGDKALWFTDGLQVDTLIYDPTHALATSIDHIRDGESGFGLATRHLVGHFYIEHEFSR